MNARSIAFAAAALAALSASAFAADDKMAADKMMCWRRPKFDPPVRVVPTEI
jgi:hypothetical protein